MKWFLTLFTQKGEKIPINSSDYKNFQDLSNIILVKYCKKKILVCSYL